MTHQISAVHSTASRIVVICLTFLLFACGGGGGANTPSASAAPAQLASVAPSLMLSSSSNAIAYNGAATISWSSTNTNSCISSGGGGTGTSGSFTTGPLTGTASFTVSCTGSNGTVTQSTAVNVAPPVVPNCSTTGATNAINLSNVPSRLSGVAPLSIFFDASGTTATSTSRPYHDLEYRWNFGDSAGSPVSGTTWKYGARANVSSRNVALGPQTAHVFETPGTYAVGLTVTDGTNTVSNDCVRIVVQDPEVVFANTNTVCFSTAGNFANCPSGAGRVQTTNFGLAVNTYIGTNKRMLFRRGETFDSAQTANISSDGPGMIGSFGVPTDPKPVVRRASSTQYSGVVKVGTSATSLGDWRIVDLDIDGQGVIQEGNAGVIAGGRFNQLLILRADIRRTYRGVLGNHEVLAVGQPDFDGWTIADSTMTGIPNCNSPAVYICDWRIYITGRRISIQGNSLDNEDTGGSHVLRSPHMTNSVISNNLLARAGSFQHALKLHSWAWTGGYGGNSTPGTYSEKVLISDNKIVGGTNGWTVVVTPQDDTKDERIRDVLIERNWLTAGSNTQVGIYSSASSTTIRNNIIDAGVASSGNTGVLLAPRGVEPPPNLVNVFNNTFLSQSTIRDLRAVELGVATNIVIKNNLAYAPSSPNGSTMVFGTGSGGLVQSNNSTSVQIKTISPSWNSPTPVVPSDFKLATGSYAIGAGTSVPVFSDFFLQPRLSNDLGATIQ